MKLQHVHLARRALASDRYCYTPNACYGKHLCISSASGPASVGILLPPRLKPGMRAPITADDLNLDAPHAAHKRYRCSADVPLYLLQGPFVALTVQLHCLMALMATARKELPFQIWQRIERRSRQRAGHRLWHRSAQCWRVYSSPPWMMFNVL